MNCPGHCAVYNHRVRSYKDLPLRMAEFGVLHRNEASGALTGLTRVRRFVQDDAHIFCRKDQIQEEVSQALDFLQYVYELFDFEFDCALSTRPKKALGDMATWLEAEKGLEEALQKSGLKWKLNPGDGAFYGPKIDIRLKDCLGRFHQCGTIQLDFLMPKNFNCTYRTEEYGKEDKLGTDHAVMVHRAVLGSLERFTAIMIEHFGSRLPFWLSPRQIKVLPISEKSMAYAEHIYNQFQQFDLECGLDKSDNTINKKIRNAQHEQYNYFIIVGEKEMSAGQLQLRSRESPKNETMSLEECFDFLMRKNMPSSRKAEFKAFNNNTD